MTVFTQDYTVAKKYEEYDRVQDAWSGHSVWLTPTEPGPRGLHLHLSAAAAERLAIGDTVTLTLELAQAEMSVE